MEMALTFNGITLTPITYQNSPWIRAAELDRALGYSDTRKITHLYERNADEFTPEMTQVIEISDVPEMGTLENLKHKARIFSLRGCHLVAMFARTPVAKAFRRWVLDVLDKLDAEQHAASPSPTPDDFTGTLSITPSTTEDRKPLRALVGSWAQVSGLPFAACWSCGRTGHGARPASGKSSCVCCGNWTPAAATCSATPCPTWAAMPIPCSARSACWTACSRAARKPSNASARPWRTPACTCA